MRLFLLLLLVLAHGAAGEELKIGLVRTVASGHVFIALERGYFAAEGFEAKLVPFATDEPVAIAVLTGNCDVGVAALTAGFYALAGQGELRLVAGQSRDLPAYRNIAYLASNSAYAAGLRAPKDLAGHSLAITQIGAPGHYALGRLAEKYGFDLKSVRLVPLSSFPNIVTALAGNRVDAGMLAATPAITSEERGAARLIGWTGDETPSQAGGVFVTTLSANDRPEFVERFLRAYVRGARDYFAAFSAPDGTRHDGPDAPAARAIIAKYTGESPAEIARATAYVDPDARFDAADILRQIAWYKAHNMLKDEVEGAALIDRRYVKALPKE
ncbi:MAG TPA: ABC transporter substrate-binding protein [Stellaceae bacterium]|nr:ABC transporter substrate-binding protein [Stellaceae bacterium]